MKEVPEPITIFVLTAIDTVPEAAVNPLLLAPASFQYCIPSLSPSAVTAVVFSTNCTAFNLSEDSLASKSK